MVDCYEEVIVVDDLLEGGLLDGGVKVGGGEQEGLGWDEGEGLAGDVQGGVHFIMGF